jgi:predicted component of type VI protein secretion system
MTTDRGGEGVARLGDGRVLVVGGFGSGASVGALASAELYDPKTGKFSPTGSMGGPREYATARCSSTAACS